MENQNSCCFVATISEIKPIEGADNIEQAVVSGWNCIIQKNSYKPNDLVVVATTDAVIPVELSDRLSVTNYLRKGRRVRTVKLRGVYSECLIIPAKHIPGFGDGYHEGMDLMEKMGIHKYEPPARQIQLSSGRKIKYSENPNFHVYYKFPNIKNVPGIFTEKDNVQITRKLHGTNARYGIVKKRKLSFLDKLKKFFRLADQWIHYEFVVGSHNVEKGSDSQGYYDTNVWYEIEKKYDLKSRLWAYAKRKQDYLDGVGLNGGIGSGIILYGEIYGHGIQKNYDYGLKDMQFAAFDITIDGEYENPFYVKHAVQVMGLQHVPELYVGPWSEAIQNRCVINNFIEGTKIPHEGVVIKHASGNRVKRAKVINPDYLIYGEKHDVGDSH